MTATYLFDIDGTLADPTHRLHHIEKHPRDWDAFFADCGDDVPIPHICELARTLNDADHTIVLVSGRSNQCRTATEAWRRLQGLDGLPLYMRRAGDHRPDDEIKGELLDLIVADGFQPTMVFEDRSRVVAMWRRRGIPCAQVAEGDF